MFRIFAPWLIDKTVKRVLYLDCDMLCTGPVTELFTLDMKDKIFGACQEVSQNVFRRKEMREKYPCLPYCNSGTILYSLENARGKYTEDGIAKIIEDNAEKFKYPDQDLLNLYFYDDLLFINTWRYNFQLYELKGNCFYKPALKNASVLHWSANKPWHKSASLHMIRLYRKLSLYPPMKKLATQYIVRKVLLYPFSILIRLSERKKRKADEKREGF